MRAQAFRAQALRPYINRGRETFTPTFTHTPHHRRGVLHTPITPTVYAQYIRPKYIRPLRPRHTPNTYAHYIRPRYTPITYAHGIHPIHTPNTYEHRIRPQYICPIHTNIAYAQHIRPIHTPIAYAPRAARYLFIGDN